LLPLIGFAVVVQCHRHAVEDYSDLRVDLACQLDNFVFTPARGPAHVR